MSPILIWSPIRRLPGPGYRHCAIISTWRWLPFLVGQFPSYLVPFPMVWPLGSTSMHPTSIWSPFGSSAPRFQLCAIVLTLRALGSFPGSSSSFRTILRTFSPLQSRSTHSNLSHSPKWPPGHFFRLGEFISLLYVFLTL